MRLVPRPETALGIEAVARVLRDAIGGHAREITELGTGAFGRVFRAGDVVVKLYRFDGFAQEEHRALEALRARAPVAVPQPIASVEGESEALVMSYLPGADGRALVSLTGRAADHVADQIVELLLSLHDGGAGSGFGSIHDPSASSWSDFFVGWCAPYHAILERDPPPDPAVARAASESWARAEVILASAPLGSELVHGDFCLGNLLYDPDTREITGLIDPLDAVWGDPVLDLIHLTKSNGHRLQLLERYAARAVLDDDAMRRYWFYMFWRWLSYQMRLGIDATDWLSASARKLLDVLDA